MGVSKHVCYFHSTGRPHACTEQSRALSQLFTQDMFLIQLLLLAREPFARDKLIFTYSN